MRVPQGAPARVSLVTTDYSGALVTPNTETLTIQKPDLTTQAYSSPVNDSLGKYHQDVPAADITQLGHYQWKWVVTGSGAAVTMGNFDVFDPFETQILSIEDAKDMLNIPQTVLSFDQELGVWISTTLGIIERFTGGPVINRAITERVEVTTHYTTLVLRKRPVVSVTSITDIGSGTVLDISAGLDIDSNASILRRKLGLPFIGRGPYFSVVYVAGWGVPVPPAFNAAARILLQNLWSTQRGPDRRPELGDESLTSGVQVRGLGYQIRNQVLELLDPYTLQKTV